MYWKTFWNTFKGIWEYCLIMAATIIIGFMIKDMIEDWWSRWGR